jgi:putative transposase
MPSKHHKPEQIIAKLRQIEVFIAQGKVLAAACKDAGISEQSYYRWKKEYGGLKIDQAKKLKELNERMQG